MDLRIDHYIHFSTPVDLLPVISKLDVIISLLTQQGVRMAADFATLQTQVTANTDAELAAADLLGKLHALLVAAQASGDPAQLASVIDQLGTSQAALTKAIFENTVPS